MKYTITEEQKKQLIGFMYNQTTATMGVFRQIEDFINSLPLEEKETKKK